MKHLHKFENFEIVNKSELDVQGNWSADHATHAKAGRKPYKKTGFTLTEVELRKGNSKFGPVKSLPTKGIVFLKPELVEKLNALGSQIEEQIKTYDQLFDSMIYTAHSKGYEESGMKGSGVKMMEGKDETKALILKTLEDNGGEMANKDLFDACGANFNDHWDLMDFYGIVAELADAGKIKEGEGKKTLILVK
jgi:hypothetical protein